MKQTLRRAFVDTLPVMTGYLVLGFGFGLLSILAGTVCHMLLVQLVF